MLHDDGFDQEMKDKILEALVAKMEDILGGGLKARKGMAVEVQAPDKEHLKDGLDKAKEVVSKASGDLEAGKEEEPADDHSDEQRLAELLGDEEDEEEEKEI